MHRENMIIKIMMLRYNQRYKYIAYCKGTFDDKNKYIVSLLWNWSVMGLTNSFMPQSQFSPLQKGAVYPMGSLMTSLTDTEQTCKQLQLLNFVWGQVWPGCSWRSYGRNGGLCTQMAGLQHRPGTVSLDAFLPDLQLGWHLHSLVFKPCPLELRW